MHPEAKNFKFSSNDILPFDVWPENIPQDAMLKEDSLILLPPYIHGYFLKDKGWGRSSFVSSVEITVLIG